MRNQWSRSEEWDADLEVADKILRTIGRRLVVTGNVRDPELLRYTITEQIRRTFDAAVDDDLQINDVADRVGMHRTFLSRFLHDRASAHESQLRAMERLVLACNRRLEIIGTVTEPTMKLDQQANIADQIADAIKEANAAGYTNKQIAESSGCTEVYISELKNGKRRNIHTDTAQRILAAIGKKLLII